MVAFADNSLRPRGGPLDHFADARKITKKEGRGSIR